MKKIKHIILASLTIGSFLFTGCGPSAEENAANNAAKAKKVARATTTVETDLNGKTVEQNNIIARLQEDNKPGSIKHLYIISATSGQVLLYSTVKGKVTSSGKRISPMLMAMCGGGQYDSHSYNPDLIQDDGTFGTSVEYIYWWDSKGVYHQQYPSAGIILHISNQPIAVKSVTLNLELNNETK